MSFRSEGNFVEDEFEVVTPRANIQFRPFSCCDDQTSVDHDHMQVKVGIQEVVNATNVEVVADSSSSGQSDTLTIASSAATEKLNAFSAAEENMSAHVMAAAAENLMVSSVAAEKQQGLEGASACLSSAVSVDLVVLAGGDVTPQPISLVRIEKIMGEKPSMEEVIAFGGIATPTSLGIRSSERLSTQPNADASVME